MAGTDDRDADRLPGRRQHDRTAAAHDDGADPEAADDIEAVTRLMGFLR